MPWHYLMIRSQTTTSLSLVKKKEEKRFFHNFIYILQKNTTFISPLWHPQVSSSVLALQHSYSCLFRSFPTIYHVLPLTFDVKVGRGGKKKKVSWQNSPQKRDTSKYRRYSLKHSYHTGNNMQWRFHALTMNSITLQGRYTPFVLTKKKEKKIFFLFCLFQASEQVTSPAKCVKHFMKCSHCVRTTPVQISTQNNTFLVHSEKGKKSLFII